MKKIFLINLFAVAILFTVFICAKNEDTACSMQCSSGIQKGKQPGSKVIGGGEKDEQLFQFNRIYIKL